MTHWNDGERVFRATRLTVGTVCLLRPGVGSAARPDLPISMGDRGAVCAIAPTGWLQSRKLPKRMLVTTLS
jgi:hypothetical protein